MTAHVAKMAHGPCIECGTQPADMAAYPECSAIARALFKRGRASHIFEVRDLFGLIDSTGKPSQMLAMQVLSVGDEGEALDAAHKTRSEQSKRAGDGKEEAKADANAFAAEQNLEALFRVCRLVDDKGQATPLIAFPGTRWMRDNLSTDTLAMLVNLYDELKRRHAPVKVEIDDETVETIAKVLHQHLGDDLPEAILAPYPRWFLTHLCVLLAGKLGDARKSTEILLTERETWEAERATLEAQRGEDAGPTDAESADAQEG